MLTAVSLLIALLTVAPPAPQATDEAGVREALNHYLRTIDEISIAGTAASAKATLVHGTTTFTDYFVLLKVDGTWKIANKVYTVARASQ